MKRQLLLAVVAVVWLGGASCAGDGPRCLWDDPSCEHHEPSCVSGPCGSDELSANPYCGADCQRLEQRSQGCIGSHTEQDCEACGVPYVRVGGDDQSTPFYDARGEMVAIRIVGAGNDRCEDAWFGIDLSECAPTSEVRQVACDPQGS